MRFTESASNFRPHGCRDSTGDPPKRGQEFHSRRESEHYISARTRIQALEEEWAISFKLPGRHSRQTKELTGTLPYALSMRPSIITASSEDCHDVTTALQIEDANVALQGRTVRVQTVYHIGSRCCET